MVDVVAALIRDGERFLICKRPAHKARALMWEFPGGKVEAGETDGAALSRELREELGIFGEAGAFVGESEFAIGNGTVNQRHESSSGLKLKTAPIVGSRRAG